MYQEIKKQIAKLRKEGKEQEASKLESNSEGYQYFDFTGNREVDRHNKRLAMIGIAVIVFLFFLLFIAQFFWTSVFVSPF